MNDVAIRVQELGKRYRLGKSRAHYSTLRDQIRNLSSLPKILRRGRRTERRPSFWALKDVSFEVGRGEVIGIIGRNGAGKSTLLKILSRITEPTEGEADIHGRVSSLLEVGTGFHPELSGRENLYLNGAILGMGRSEISRKFDRIVAFAEIDKFIDTPVKHYSSGMYTRLAFSVAAHLEPDILIVDEVLAVGDAQFQKKCLGKMSEVARGGRTVMFVSHNLHAIHSLCTRGVVLHDGRVAFQGSASASVSKYLELGRNGTSDQKPLRVGNREGTGEWRLTHVAATRSVFNPSEAIEVVFRVVPSRAAAGAVYLSGCLVNEEGITVTQFDSRLVGASIPGPNAGGGRLRISGIWLKPGRYSLDMYVCSKSCIVDRFERSVEFEVSPVLPYPCSASPDAVASALVLADFAWNLEP